MKKLLSILGAVSMVASTGTAVVACNNKNNDYSQMSNFLEGVAKTVYLNTRYNYDVDYVLQENVYSTDEGKQYFDANFGGQLWSESLSTVGFTKKTGKLPTDKDAIIKIATIGEQLLGLDSSQDQNQQLVDLISSATSMLGIDLSTGVSAEQKVKIEKIGTIVEEVGKALDMSNYQGLTYVNAINKAIVNFVNQLNSATGIGSSDFIEAKFKEAMQALTQTVRQLRQQEGGFNFNVIIDRPTILGALIDTVKLTLLYVGDFINNSGNDINSTAISNQTVLDYRKTTLPANSVLDLKGVLEKLDDALLGSDASTTGPVALKNIIKLLFVNGSEADYEELTIDSVIKILQINRMVYQENDFGFPWLVSSFVNGMIDLEFEVSGLKVQVNVGTVLNIVLGLIGSGKPIMTDYALDQLLELAGVANIIPADLLAGVRELVTSADPLKVIWNRNILGPIFALLAGLSGDFSINGLLNSPLSQIFGLDGIFGLDFITSGDDKLESISDIIKLVINKAGTDDIKISPQKLSNVFQTFANLIKTLPDYTGDINGLVALIPSDVRADLFSVAQDAKGLKQLLTFFKETATVQKADLISGVKTNFAALTVSASPLSETQFKYTVERKQITVTLEKVGAQYKIKKVLVQ